MTQQGTDGHVYPLKNTNMKVTTVVPRTPADVRLQKNNRVPVFDNDTNEKRNHSTVKKAKLPKRHSSRIVKKKREENESNHLQRQLKVFLLFVAVLVGLSLYHSRSGKNSNDIQHSGYNFFSEFQFPEYLSHQQDKATSHPVDDSQYRAFIQQQFARVNEQMNSIITSQFEATQDKLSHQLNKQIYDLNRQFKQFASDKEVTPTKEELENLQTAMNKIAENLRYDAAKEHSSIRNDIYDINQEFQATVKRLQGIREEVEKHKRYENQITALNGKVDTSGNRVDVLYEQMQQLSTKTGHAHNEVSARMKRLEDRIENIERKFLTKEEASHQFAELQSRFDAIQPLTLLDVNQIVGEYLNDHGYQSFDEDAIYDLIRIFTSKNGVTLDQLREEDYRMLRDQISSYALREMHRVMFEDSVGKPDFALSAVGAKVIDYTGKWAINNILDAILPFGEKPHPPSIALEGHKEVGDCWAFHGSTGFLTIRLSSTILPESVSLEHIASSIAHTPNLSSAPKEFRVYGYTQEGSKPIFLGTFEYDRYGPEVQNFPIDEQARDTPISVVKIEFLSNYGNSYTCVYRFRVHGNKVDIRS